jgi:PTS system N-acetylglucosamine-specific IIB component
VDTLGVLPAMSAGRRRLVTDIAEQNPGTGTRVRDMKVVVMSKAEQIVAGLGGADNIDEVEACITRLRVEVGDENLVDESALKEAGAFGVVAQGTAVQVVVGPEADLLVEDIEDLMD